MFVLSSYLFLFNKKYGVTVPDIGKKKEKKKESLHDKMRKKSMQIKKRKKLKQNKKRKKVIEAQSTSFSEES